MTYINYSACEINVKIVVLGGANAGDIHPVEALYNELPAKGRGQFTSLGDSNNQTIFYDYLPDGVEPIRDFRIRVHLFGAAGQSAEGPNLKLLLKGADGAIFLGPPGQDQAMVEELLNDGGIPYVTANTTGNLQGTIADLVNTFSR